jgi:hypothetical protein
MDSYSKLEDAEVWNIGCHFEPLLIYFCLLFCSKDQKWQEWQNLLAQIQLILFKKEVPTSSKPRDFLRKLSWEVREPCPL